MRFRFIAVTLLALTASLSMAGSSGKGVKCSQIQVKDDERTGDVAYTYLMPDGWNSDKSLKWNGNTYIAEFGASSADKHYVVDHLEPVNMTYTEGPGIAPRGLKLTHASDFLHALINRMQQQRGDTNVQIVEEVNTELPLTDIQKQILAMRMIGGMSHSAFHETAYMKITFERDGVEETANMVTTVAGNLQANNMTLGFGTNQQTTRSENDTNVIGPTLLVITPSQAPQAKLKEAQIISSSYRMTPQFALYCAKTALAMARGAVEAGAEKTKQLQRDIENQTAKSMEDFKTRMAARDANVHDFCNYVLGQQDFHAPDGSIVTLPANYDHVWSDGQGGYVLSNDANYDPRGTGTNWQQMTKSEHGG